jgi:3,4-dihydroxy 2-butanone 4-phosphate synthase/GTP cyclohydrolase II
MSLATIPEALEALRAGRPVIVADDENRENEGDIILSAQLATPEWLAWTIRWSSGFICAPMPAEWADRLDLPPMVAVNEDARGTAYTVSVDAADRVSTGISATDRSHTLNVLADPASVPSSVIRPGHILPLRAVDGGVRERAGHTEAGVELMRLAGLQPVAAIGEVVAEDGSMMRLPGLMEMGEREGVPVITIEQLIAYLDEVEPVAAPAARRPKRRVSLRAEATVPTSHGTFRFLAYKDRVTGTDHIAVVSGTSPRRPARARALRVPHR